MKKKIMTQKKAVFYILYKAHKENAEQFVPTWKFVGELHVPEIDEWFMMSYKCPTNGLEIYFDNPNLLERRYVSGKTGAKYYEYRFSPNATPSNIIEKELIEFLSMIKR
jgi:hypothetical protein